MMSDETQNSKLETRNLKLDRRWKAIYLGAIVFVSLPYAISFTSQLCSDDFILLHYYGTRPLWRILGFFLPRTLWTYHPLQHYYFAVGWHISGIEPWAYRTMSLAVHFGTALLLLKLGRDLTDSIHVGGCAAVVFAGQWRQWEAISWAASIATPESTFFSALACVAFLSFLRRRRVAAYMGMILASMGWFFSKETIIQLPLLLVAIYFYRRWYERNGLTQFATRNSKLSEATEWRDLVRLLAAPVAIVAVYLVFYALFVHNVYTLAKLGYEKMPVKDWPSNTFTWLDYALNPLVENEVVMALGGGMLMQIARWYLVSAAVILITFYLALFRRRMLPLFALTLTLILMIPYVALRCPYLCFRYYYGLMPGVALLVVALGYEALRSAGKKRGGWQSWLRIVVGAAGGLWVVASIAQLANCALHDRDANRVSRELYDFFASQPDKADRPVLFVVDTGHVQHDVDVELGWGLLECARLALRSDKIAAVELGFDLDRNLLKEFNGYSEKYLVLRKEDGWWSSRLPDEFRLTIAPGEQGGVALEKGP